jgi:hypothetical protein
MTDQILEPTRCGECGEYITPPLDRVWRWSRGTKVFDSLEAAQKRAEGINRTTKTAYEFQGAVDPQGRPRIASRRTA